MLVPSHPDVPTDLPYDLARELCKSSDIVVRGALAGHPDCPPEILFFLASDSDAAVRFIVAQNEKTPRQADMLLATDSDHGIRERLATKIGQMTPKMSQDHRDKLSEATYAVLDQLVRDQVPEVRKIIADTLKSVANAPHDTIKLLATDSEISVAEPVLRFSPVLTDEDLIEIITSDPIDGAMNAISRRDTVAENVSDALVEHGSEETISILLNNDSAQIREETLDILAERGENIQTWHAPFIQRSFLPARAARRLAAYIAMDLLEKLQGRADLDEDTLKAVKKAVQQRIDGEKTSMSSVPDDDAEDHVQKEVHRFYESGKLDSELVEDRLANGERRFVVESLSVLSKYDTSVLYEVIKMRNAEMLVALAWKAGLTAHLALQLQIHLAQIAPSKLIPPKNGEHFRLTDKEMKSILKEL